MKKLLALVVALVIGFLAGWLARPDGGEGTPARQPVADAPNEQPAEAGREGRKRAPDSGAVASQPRVDAEERSTPPRTVPDAPPGANSSELLARAVAALPAVEKPRGTGVISGRVTLRAGGGPLAGVLITARAEDNRRNPQRQDSTSGLPQREPPKPEATDLVKAARQAIESARAWDARAYYATSGADGSYALTELPDTKFDVRAEAVLCDFATDYGVADGGGSLRSAAFGVRPNATVNWTGVRKYEAAVTVILPDGSRARDVTLAIRNPEGARDMHVSLPWYGDIGDLTVEAGEYEVLEAQLPWDLPGWKQADVALPVEPVKFTLGPANPRAEVTIQLRAVPTLHVQLVAPLRSSPFSWDGVLYCLPAENERLPEPVAVPGQPQPKEVSLNGSRATQESFTALKPGHYALMLVRGGKTLASQIVLLTDRSRTVSLEVPGPERADYVIARIVNGKGEPISERPDFLAMCVVNDRAENCRPAYWKQADGTWAVTHFARKDGLAVTGEGVRWGLLVEFPALGGRFATYTLGETAELEFRFAAATTVEITVPNLEGHPLAPRLSVSVVERRPEPFGGIYVREWGDKTAKSYIRARAGTITFGPTGLGIAEAALSIDRTPYGRQMRPVDLVTVKFQIVEGVNKIAIPMPETFTVTVAVPDVAAGSRVSMDPTGADAQVRRSLDAVTGEDRVATFDAVLAGDWRIRVESSQGKRYRDRTVNVPAETVVTLRPQE